MIQGLLTNLRAIDRNDAGLIHHWLDDPELMRWWGIGAAAISLATVQLRVEQWIVDESVTGHPVAFIAQTLEGEPVGMVILSELQPVDRSCELSLFLEREHRGMGMGGDLLEAIADAAFEHWNLHRLTVRSESQNEDAHAFFERHGFELEGRLREARYVDGSWSDILVFGRLDRPKNPR